MSIKTNHTGPKFPTLITKNSASTTDIVIINNYGTYITKVNATTSEHLLIQAISSTLPIMIPNQPQPDNSNADWEKYKGIFNNICMSDLQNRSYKDLDTEKDRWFKGTHTKEQFRIIAQHQKNKS